MQTVRGGITVIIVLMADGNEVQELREQIYQAKQVVKRIKDVTFILLIGDQIKKTGRIDSLPGYFIFSRIYDIRFLNQVISYQH